MTLLDLISKLIQLEDEVDSGFTDVHISKDEYNCTEIKNVFVDDYGDIVIE